MQQFRLWILRLAILLAVAGCASPQPSKDVAQPTITITQPAVLSPTVSEAIVPTAQPFASPLPSPTPAPAELPAPTTPLDAVSPLPSPSTDTSTWRRISLPGGGSFAYPPEASIRMKVDIHFSDPLSEGAPTPAAEDAALAVAMGFSVEAVSLPPDQESTLYYEVGDTWTYRESPEFHVPWAKTVQINDLDWHLYLVAYNEPGAFGITAGRADYDRLYEKGAMTSATLHAVRYDKREQLAVSLSQPLTLDQLVILDAQGMDAMYPEQFEAFSDTLGTVAFLPTPSMDTASRRLLLPAGASFTLPAEARRVYVSVQADDLNPSIAGTQTSDAEGVPFEAKFFSVEAWPLPPDQESTLHPQVGDTRIDENLEYSVRWARMLRINGFDWWLYMRQLRTKGVIKAAILQAVHYDKSAQLVVGLRQQLTPDQRVILNTRGGDAIFPEQFKAFSDTLSTFTFSP